MPDGKRHRTLFIERSVVPCRTCGKPHDHRWTGHRSTLSTWADPGIIVDYLLPEADHA
jgi:hypothetical protein